MKKIASMPRSAEHNKKVAEANLGKILVNNGINAKRISKEKLEEYQSLGWSKGGLPRKKMYRQLNQAEQCAPNAKVVGSIPTGGSKQL